MRYESLGFAGLLLSAQLGGAQTMPATIGQAEADGAAFPHGAAGATTQAVFIPPAYRGTPERRCLSPAQYDSVPMLSLRSGEFVIRTIFTGEWGLHAGRDTKILWMPLHGASDRGTPLLVRAARLAYPSDSLRQTIDGLTHGVRSADYGYPSLVRFPSAGQWLVIATTGDEWGCFLLTVAD